MKKIKNIENEYIDYLCENLEKSIDFTEYLSENISSREEIVRKERSRKIKEIFK